MLGRIQRDWTFQIAGGNAKQYSILEKYGSCFKRYSCTCHLTQHFHLFQRNENTYPHLSKALFTVLTALLFIGAVSQKGLKCLPIGKMDKEIVVYPYNRLPFNNNKEGTTVQTLQAES